MMMSIIMMSIMMSAYMYQGRLSCVKEPIESLPLHLIGS